MSNVDDYNSKIGIVQGRADEDTKYPNMPVDVYTQESENLAMWARPDKNPLVAAGLKWALVKDMPVRAGCLREAESRWYSKRFTREEAQREWMERSPEAYDLRDQLLHTFTYAYRKHADVAARVSKVREGSNQADMIQDLNDLAVIGRDNPEPLDMINFDKTLLDLAANTADEMGSLLASSKADDDDAELVKIRNKAYTYLKEAVDEVRDCGQFVFWRNRERIKGYRSDYHHRQNRGRKKDDDVMPETPEVNK